MALGLLGLCPDLQQRSRRIAKACQRHIQSLLSPTQTYDIALFGEVNFLLFHSSEYDLESVQQVLEYCDLPLFPLFFGETLGVYQAHLFEYCRFPRFAGTYSSTVSTLALRNRDPR